MLKNESPAVWHRATNVFASVALIVLVIACLYWVQAVFIPIAIAVFLTFLLSMPVAGLQRIGFNRVFAVVTTVALTGLLLTGVGWAIGRQVTSLVKSLPEHKKTIRSKIVSLKEFTEGGALDDLRNFADEMTREFGGNTERPGGQTVVVQPEGTTLSRIPESLGHLLEPLASAAMVAILVVFMLIKRENLRNRLIGLIGHGRILVTTRAVDDIGKRISRYLVAQAVLNSTFGLLFGIGLWLIGVPYAFLWGALATLSRYIPYVGIWVAVTMPLVMSIATSEGWMQPLLMLALLAVLEIAANNIAEPLLYGHSIGVSEVALLVAAAFWAWLWGPIGLVLSGPLTVCLVVLGKYVPALRFFDVLLGDTPPLEPKMVFYQRLLAHDQDEAADVVEEYCRLTPPERVYDDLLLPALTFAKRDAARSDMTAADEEFVRAGVAEVAEDIRPERGPAGDVPVKLLGVPARDANDEQALRLLSDLLDAADWELDVLSPATLSSELLDRVAAEAPAALCIASLPPGGLAHTRYLCKRLRQRFPDLKIVIGRWGDAQSSAGAGEALTASGADRVSSTLLEAKAQLTEWLPVFRAAGPEAERRDRNMAASDTRTAAVAGAAG